MYAQTVTGVNYQLLGQIIIFLVKINIEWNALWTQMAKFWRVVHVNKNLLRGNLGMLLRNEALIF